MASAAALPVELQLPKISRDISSLVTRVMGLNPGPFTLSGSCTYLVGNGPKKTLIDTGHGVKEYSDVVNEALTTPGEDSSSPSKGMIERILLTHSHEDHIGGIEQILNLTKQAGHPFPPVYKLPSKVRPNSGGDQILREMIRSATKDQSADFIPLKAGDVFSAGENCTLSVQPTPGHCEDHVVFYLKEEEAFFTGDTVLGYGTTVFMNYPDFMESLGGMVEKKPKVLYPGHGPVVTDALGKLHEYINHRNKREEQIVNCMTLNKTADKPKMTPMDVVEQVYLETPQHLHFAAAMNVSHHLKKLWREGKVEPVLEGDSSGRGEANKALLTENEYLLDKGKESDPERGRVEQLITIPWKLIQDSSKL